MLDFSHLPNTLSGADIQTFNALGASDFQTWLRPRGKSMISILSLSSGAGGGGGFSAAASTARGGGGGGGAGTLTRFLAPLIDIDRLYINVPLGGLGGAAGVAGATAGNGTVSLAPNLNTAVNAIFNVSGALATGGGAGTASAAGAAGVGAVTSGAAGQGNSGILSVTAGQAGLIGGAQTGAVGGSLTFTSGNPFTGGMGGAGVTTTDFAGGSITGAGWFPSFAGGIALGGRGADGWFSRMPFGASGGTGGGSNNAGTGGAGGNGALGCGGGGGGGGVTGGQGGNGGHGLVIITCW